MVFEHQINEFVQNVPSEVKQYLRFQENSFSATNKYDKIHKRIAEHLCSKTNKSEDTLLLNRAPKLRIITEIKDMVESQKPIENNFGNNKWILSLRKGPNNIEEEKNKCTYINVGKDSSPVFTMINENYKKVPEFITTPFKESTLPKIESVSKMKLYNDTKEKFNISIEQRFNHSDLKVTHK